MIRRRLLVVGALATAAMIATGSAPGTAPSSLPRTNAALVDRLDAYVRTLAHDGRFSGAVLVARGGTVLLARGYGSARLRPERLNTPSTTFRIGSITKTLTAVAVLQLVQQGRLRLDASVCSVAPACPRSWRPITIRMLLAHTAGISSRLDEADWSKLKRLPLPRVVRRLESLPLEFRPGTRWSYCNACYLVAGYVVERVAPTDWLAYLRRRILRPAGMTATASDSGLLPATGALAYVPDRFGVLRRAPRLAMANPDPAGGLRSTVLDLYRFSRALSTKRLLSARFLRLLFAGTSASGHHWSLGWELGSRDGHSIERHTGAVGGWSGVLSRYPRDRLTIVVLCNACAGSAAQLNHDLPSIVLGWPVGPPQLPPLAKIDPAVLRGYVGRYRATSPNRLDLQINRSADGETIVLYPGPYGGGDRLGALSKRRFVDLRAPQWTAEFRGGGRAAALVVRSTRPRISFVARRVRAGAATLRLTPPTGAFPVGTRSVMLVDRARRDPFDPRHASRRLMVRVWYPTKARGRRAAYLPPRVGRIYARSYGLSPATFARVATNSVAAARPAGARGSHRVIIFSPGYGVPSALYTTLLEELASRGFVVLAVDHTYETEAVEFPGGVVVRRRLPENPTAKSNPASYRLTAKVINTRIADVALVLRKLRWLNMHVAGRTMDPRRVGIFGHSLGGLTAAAVAAARPTIRAAADLDGSLFGRAVRARPSGAFLIMTEHGDGTMARYWARLRAPRLFVRINGTRHLNFSDWNVLAPWLRRVRSSLSKLGPIAPRRALAIERAYLDAFFARYLAGADAPLLDRPPPYPEVAVKR